MSDDDGDFHSPLPSSDSRATGPSSHSEWESRSAATTEDARSNGNRSQDNFSHVDYEHLSDDSAAKGDPWWTDWDETTLQELFETSPRESMGIRAASEAGSTSSESVEDAADALQLLSMTVPPGHLLFNCPRSRRTSGILVMQRVTAKYLDQICSTCACTCPCHRSVH